MRAIIASILLLAACGRTPPPAPVQPPARAVAAASIWFICDSVDTPVLMLFGDAPGDGRTRLTIYDKPSGASGGVYDLTLGPAEGAAGSSITPLLLNGVEVGAVRQLNPDMMETPGAAYTPPFVGVRFRGAGAQCRWLPRTRMMAFTGRRSILVHEDADGDLIYTAYDFTGANAQAPIDLSDNGRTTPFSVEVRGGNERIGPGGARFAFAAADGHGYVVEAQADGAGRLAVTADGAAVQEEALIAFQLGEAR